MTSEREYAQAGVDPRKIGKFKDIMKMVGKKTLEFPKQWSVVVESSAHGASVEYLGNYRHKFFTTQEGLGNKNWIAEWMYQFAGTGKTYHKWIGWDTALMAVNDVIASGAMPVKYLDEVAAGDSEWFADKQRSLDLAQSYYDICKEVGMALPAGESPSLRYLIKAEPPVTSAPVLSGCVVGILAPAENEVPGYAEPGDRIIGFASSGIHCNGISAVIKRAMQLPDKFLTKLPNGNTLGEEALLPTRSYARLVKALQYAETPIHKFLPGTGDGVAKLCASDEHYTYHIETWPEDRTPLVEFMQETGTNMLDSLTTFNNRIGYYAFVAPGDARETVEVAEKAGYPAYDLGRVEEGERYVVFGPEGDLKLPPQDE